MLARAHVAGLLVEEWRMGEEQHDGDAFVNVNHVESVICVGRVRGVKRKFVVNSSVRKVDGARCSGDILNVGLNAKWGV